MPVDDLGFSSKTKRLIKQLRKAEVGLFESEFNLDSISDYNQKELRKNKYFRRLTYKDEITVHERTFIIPTENGAITAYFFEKVFNNSNAGLRSLIIFYHGGGWMYGNMDMYKGFCNKICALTGACVLSVDYHLAPNYKFPIPVDDCYASLEWASNGAKYWGVDSQRIYLMGSDAGASLAFAVARLARNRKGPSIAGLILLCPITDARMRTKSYEDFANMEIMSAKMLNSFITNYQREPRDILDPSFSPMLSKDLSRLPDTLIIVSDHDVLHDDGVLFSKALTDADTQSKVLEVQDSFHSFYHFPKAKGSKLVLNAVAQFVGGRAIKNVELLDNRAYKKFLNNKRLK